MGVEMCKSFGCPLVLPDSKVVIEVRNPRNVWTDDCQTITLRSSIVQVTYTGVSREYRLVFLQNSNTGDIFSGLPVQGDCAMRCSLKKILGANNLIGFGELSATDSVLCPYVKSLRYHEDLPISYHRR